jgi:hypothetical protein
MPKSPEEVERELETLRGRLHAISNSVMSNNGAAMLNMKKPSNTAIVGLLTGVAGGLLSLIGIGTVLYNSGASIQSLEERQTSMVAAIARVEAAINTGRDRNERDYNRIEGLIKSLDVEQRALSTRLTQQETIVRMRERGATGPYPQSDEPIPAANGTPFTIPIACTSERM